MLLLINDIKYFYGALLATMYIIANYFVFRTIWSTAIHNHDKKIVISSRPARWYCHRDVIDNLQISVIPYRVIVNVPRQGLFQSCYLFKYLLSPC